MFCSAKTAASSLFAEPLPELDVTRSLREEDEQRIRLQCTSLPDTIGLTAPVSGSDRCGQTWHFNALKWNYDLVSGQGLLELVPKSAVLMS